MVQAKQRYVAKAQQKRLTRDAMESRRFLIGTAIALSGLVIPSVTWYFSDDDNKKPPIIISVPPRESLLPKAPATDQALPLSPIPAPPPAEMLQPAPFIIPPPSARKKENFAAIPKPTRNPQKPDLSSPPLLENLRPNDKNLIQPAPLYTVPQNFVQQKSIISDSNELATSRSDVEQIINDLTGFRNESNNKKIETAVGVGSNIVIAGVVDNNILTSNETRINSVASGSSSTDNTDAGDTRGFSISVSKKSNLGASDAKSAISSRFSLNSANLGLISPSENVKFSSKKASISTLIFTDDDTINIEKLNLPLNRIIKTNIVNTIVKYELNLFSRSSVFGIISKISYIREIDLLRLSDDALIMQVRRYNLDQKIDLEKNK